MVGPVSVRMTAAVICLIANTHRCLGSYRDPDITLGQVLVFLITYSYAGRPSAAFLLLIVHFCSLPTWHFMDKGKWYVVWKVWTATLVCGASFATAQFISSQAANVMLVDIISGVTSLIVTAIFLKIWKPKNNMGHENAAKEIPKHTTSEVVTAWMPWVFLAVAVFIWGMTGFKKFMNAIFMPKWAMPYLDKVVYHTPPVGTGKSAMAAVFNFNILTMAGTCIYGKQLFSRSLCS
jgi:lactate permease